MRLVKFTKEIEAGSMDQQAAKAARDSFHNYDINAPWIVTAKRTALPFISFSYRAIPMLLRTAAYEPWKLLKYALVAKLLNSLADSALGMTGQQQDDERAKLHADKNENILWTIPRLLRMPWNGAGGAPVFLDVRRWVPGGDIFDTDGAHTALPVLNWLSLGGPPCDGQ